VKATPGGADQTLKKDQKRESSRPGKNTEGTVFRLEKRLNRKMNAGGGKSERRIQVWYRPCAKERMGQKKAGLGIIGSRPRQLGKLNAQKVEESSTNHKAGLSPL